MSIQEETSYVQTIKLPPIVAARSSNRLLASLPAEDHARLAPHLMQVPMRTKHTIYKQDEPIEGVYFPGGGACALVKTTGDGRTTQIADVGAEGAIGASLFFGLTKHSSDVIVHMAGPAAEVLPAAIFSREMERRGALHNRIVRYNQALMVQLMQSTACNSLHSATERCARWLLAAHDRAGEDSFPMTHEFAAAMLGLRRPTVTLIAASFQNAGLIDYRRGAIRIVDRQRLEVTSCRCYSEVKRTFAN